jgi:5'-nucleotidase
MMDAMIVLSATGEQIWKALENGVCQWPKLEGRFPQVSGVRFAFDPSKPAKQRIDPKYIKVGDEYLNLNAKYRLVTKGYLHQGKDGYGILKQCDVLVSEEECPELCTSIQNHFEAIKILTAPAQHQTRHRQSLICVSRRHSVVKMHEMGGNGSPGEPASMPVPQNNSVHARSPSISRRGLSVESAARKSLASMGRKTSIDEIEFEQCRLEPKIEGRILILTDEVKQRLFNVLSNNK